MSLLSRLTEKSWEPPAAGAHAADPAEYRPEAARVGMIVYFGVATVLFALISSAYLMRMGLGSGDHPAFGDWQPMPEPPLIWINSSVLVLNSLAWEVARAGARAGQTAILRQGLWSAGILAILFLAGQLLLWREFALAGYFLQSNPANAFFYLITALHGLHLLGGLFFWGRAVIALRRDRASPGSGVRLSVELCAGYWHFLLLIWILMLGLLITT
jgi:cytochrome c oxidase subunit 3